MSIPELISDDIKDFCCRCTHYRKCESPCLPVEKYINKQGRPDYEKKCGDNLIVLHHKKKEVPFSTLCADKAYRLKRLLSDENARAFLGFNPELKQTKIVYLHLIRGISFNDLAMMFDTTQENICKHYNTSKDRLLKALRLLDHREELARKAKDVIRKG